MQRYKPIIMERLKTLILKCKASVTISINNHRDYYDTVEDKFKSEPDAEFRDEIDNDVFDEMVRTDTVIEVQFYPNSPVGFYRVYHYDIEKAIEEALRLIQINEHN